MIYIKYKTSLEDAFFLESEDNDRFEEWFNTQLQDLFAWTFEDSPEGVPGVTKISGHISEFDYKHELYVGLHIDNDRHSEDELAGNEALFTYLDRTLAYKLRDELNEIGNTITFPMNNGTFDDMKFDDNEFFGLIHYNPQYGYYLNPRIKDSQFEVYPEFDVIF